MAIKAFISRRFTPGSLKEAVELLTRTRYGAMKMKGYISSETLHRISDPVEVVVVSMWQSLEDWERWRTSPPREEFAAEFKKVMEGSEKVDLFDIGLIQDFISEE